MTNRYPGKCTKCGLTVNPEQGTCEKVNGKWVVSHPQCRAEQSKPEPKPQFEPTLPDDWEDVQSRGLMTERRTHCCKCGVAVYPYAGLEAKSAEGIWYTWHKDCSDPKDLRSEYRY